MTLVPSAHPTGAVDPPGVEEWWPRAGCRGMDPNLFFADDDESITAAKAVCRTCPVSDECLEYAMRGRIDHGVWGGMTDAERRRLRRSRARASRQNG